MSIYHIKNQQEFQEKVKQSNIPVILDFYADWCPPCQKLGTLLQQKVCQNQGFIVCKINIDEDNVSELATMHNVEGIPAVFLYHNGNKVKGQEFVGLDEKKLEEMITVANNLK